MTEKYFIETRKASWDQFEIIINSPKKELRAKNQAYSFPLLLRKISADLNTARANGFDSGIIERLNRLVLDGNQILYSVRRLSARGILNFFIYNFPASVRYHWKAVSACALIFYGLYFFTTMLCVTNEDFVYRIIDSRTRDSFDEMYNPESEYYLKPRDISSDADMFAYYIYNNVSIAFRMFAGGILAGVGSLVFLIFNAVFLGAATGFIINEGFSETFFSFTSAHSAFELNGIVLSAAAGLLLGYSFFVTGGLTRASSVRRVGKTAFPIIAGAAFIIFLAAIIEGFFSAQRDIAPIFHYITGGICELILIFYFIFCGRKREKDFVRLPIK